jgi:hypothetical protein
MDPQSEERVAELLGGLERVNAPENFESRVRSRLSVAPTGSGGLGFLKLAIPTAALAAIALFLFVSGYLNRDISDDVVVDSNTLVVPETRTAQEGAPNDRPAASQAQVPAQEQAAIQPVNSNALPVNSLRRKGVAADRSNDAPGSYDIGSNSNETIVTPPGFNTNSRPRGDANMERQMRRPTIAVTDVLRYTGVNAEFRGGECVVNSVVSKSVAERVGVKAGDVIVSLNDIRLGSGTGFPSGVDLRSITVRRGGSTVVLKF